MAWCQRFPRPQAKAEDAPHRRRSRVRPPTLSTGFGGNMVSVTVPVPEGSFTCIQITFGPVPPWQPRSQQQQQRFNPGLVPAIPPTSSRSWRCTTQKAVQGTSSHLVDRIWQEHSVHHYACSRGQLHPHPDHFWASAAVTMMASTTTTVTTTTTMVQSWSWHLNNIARNDQYAYDDDAQREHSVRHCASSWGQLHPPPDHYWANAAVTMMASTILVMPVIIPPIVSVIVMTLLIFSLMHSFTHATPLWLISWTTRHPFTLADVVFRVTLTLY